MNSENGWILPNGEYVECVFNGHIRCAEELLGMPEKELEKVAVKVSCLPLSYQIKVFGSDEYRPHFITRRDRMTKKQLATIEQYCLHFRYRPPQDFLFQKGWHDLENMVTNDILSILEKKT